MRQALEQVRRRLNVSVDLSDNLISTTTPGEGFSLVEAENLCRMIE